ncbi:hypothetical protein D3C72_648120 [compost metagenome]
MYGKVALKGKVPAQSGVQMAAGEVITRFQGEGHEGVALTHRRDVRLDVLFQRATLVFLEFDQPARQVAGEGAAALLFLQMSESQVSGGVQRNLKIGQAALAQNLQRVSLFGFAAQGCGFRFEVAHQRVEAIKQRVGGDRTQLQGQVVVVVENPEHLARQCPAIGKALQATAIARPVEHQTGSVRECRLASDDECALEHFALRCRDPVLGFAQ